MSESVLAALLLAGSGCARSAIEYQDDEAFSGRDAGVPDELENIEEDAGSEEGDESGVDAAFSEGPAHADSGGSPQDAGGGSGGAADASSSTAGDASTAADARTGTPQDSGSGSQTDASTTPADASSGPADASPPADAASTATCNVNSCSNDCAISGPFRCCTLLDTCGCSWAPGAYCL